MTSHMAPTPKQLRELSSHSLIPKYSHLWSFAMLPSKESSRKEVPSFCKDSPGWRVHGVHMAPRHGVGFLIWFARLQCPEEQLVPDLCRGVWALRSPKMMFATSVLEVDVVQETPMTFMVLQLPKPQWTCCPHASNQGTTYLPQDGKTRSTSRPILGNGVACGPT